MSDGSYIYISPTAFEEGKGQRVFFIAAGAALVHDRQLQQTCTVFRRYWSVVCQLTDGDHPGNHHSHPDRGFCCLCAGLDETARSRLYHCRDCWPARRATADVADPALALYNATGFAVSKAYLGIWLAHTGFGLPFAIYLLRSYIAGLPREI